MHYTENYTRHKPAHLVFLENDISKCNHWRKSVALKAAAAKQNCAGLLIKFAEEILGLSFLGITTFMENQMRHVLFAFQFTRKNAPVNLILL